MAGKKGSFHNNNRLVCGIGHKGCEGTVDSNGKRLVSYTRWKAILRRCSTEEVYKDVSICDEWLEFKNFKEWFDTNYIEGFEIDKDLQSGSEKIYSPSTCIFLPPEINKMLTPSQLDAKGIEKKNQKWRAKLYIGGKKTTLKVQPTEVLAYEDYKEARLLEVKRILNEHLERGNITDSVQQKIIGIYMNKFKKGSVMANNPNGQGDLSE